MTAPPTRTRRGVLVAAVLIVLFVIGNGAVQLTSQILQTRFSQNSTIVPLARQLTIVGHEGNVMVTPSPDGNVHVAVFGKYGAARPDLVEDSTDKGILLEARCGDSALVTCRVDYNVRVPASFSVTVRGGSTDVTARTLTGPLSIDLESGNANIENAAGPVQLRTGDGSIWGSQLQSSTISAHTSSGSVNLDLIAAPQDVVVGAGSGDVAINVPAEYAYKVRASSTDGRMSIGVAQDAASSRSITATSDSGDVRIRPRGRSFGPVPIPPDAPDAPPAPIAPVRPG